MSFHIELEVAQGLEDVCVSEVRQRLTQKHSINTDEVAAVSFDYSGDLQPLSTLRSATAAYVVLDYDIPRPKALLGHQNFQRLLDTIHRIIDSSYRTFTISAAGSDSSVMRRIKDVIADELHLSYDNDANDLLLRIRKHKKRWQVLVRTTPRPLATRSWRVYDVPGALNGCVAYAINAIAAPCADECYVNLMCGSGSLLAELKDFDVENAVGVDYDAEMLKTASQHLEMVDSTASLLHADVRHCPLAHSTVDVITADLPFGQLIGSHDENVTLYPQVLAEMRRLLKDDGRVVIITHEARLMENVLKAQNWRVVEVRRISLRGLHPRIYVLRK